ncbi:MAG: DNA-protecting protein DprA [Lentimicrobiaceae bacterium]|nr:DNA-protecting protein DprA [Lentimicrobiaceae bacterium]
MNHELLYEVALTLIPGIGDVNAKKLIAYCGGAEAVFEEKRKNLLNIPGIGERTVESIVSQNVLQRAERELNFADRNGIRILYYLNSDYPRRLQHCYDSPVIIYCKGYTDLNVEKIVGVVGTRNVTDYGKTLTEKLIQDLVDDDVLVVSGLAYGVDTCAHKAALKNNLTTAAVLAHGFQTIYPSANASLSRKMIESGGCLLTEHISGTEPDKENFPKRNRIVSGMIDCLVVVESAAKGGALITAEIANNYDREVFAFPGRIGDTYSEGCNKIIKTNKANLLTDVDDLRYIMRWNDDRKIQPKQMRMFREFNQEEQKVMDVFGDDNIVYLDKIITDTMLSPTKIASVLLSLEFDGILAALPGKRYQKL